METDDINRNVFEIIVRCKTKNDNCYLTLTKPKSKTNSKTLGVCVPRDNIGLNESIEIPNICDVHFTRRTQKGSNPFILSIQFKNPEHGKSYMQMNCSITKNDECRVTLTESKVRHDTTIKISCKNVSMLPQKVMYCAGHLTLESEKGLYIHSTLQSPYIALISKKGDVRISSEAKLRTKWLETKTKIGGTTFIDGYVSVQTTHMAANEVLKDEKFTNDTQKQESIVNQLHIVTSSSLHVGRDGVIGSISHNDISNDKLVEQLYLKINGTICNHGTIKAACDMKIVSKSVLSSRHCTNDTAGRYHEIIYKRFNVNKTEFTDKSESLVANSTLYDAIFKTDAALLMTLLKIGIDPSASNKPNRPSPAKNAERKLWQTFQPNDKRKKTDKKENKKKIDDRASNNSVQTDNEEKGREADKKSSNNSSSSKIEGRTSEKNSKTYDICQTDYEKRRDADMIASLVRSWEKRSGSFVALRIDLNINGDIHDFGQVTAEKVSLNITGNIVVEDTTICTLGNLSGKCDGNFKIDGLMKMKGFDYFSTKTFDVCKSGKCLIENGGNISVCEKFNNSSIIWNCGNTLQINTGIFEQEDGCLLESKGALELTISKDSNNIEGFIKAPNAMFIMEADVNENVCIETLNECTFKFKGNQEASSKHGNLRHEGFIGVYNGPLYITSSTELQGRDKEDMNVVGHIEANGLDGRSAFVRLKPSAEMIIYPNTEKNSGVESGSDHDKNHQVDRQRRTIRFLLGILETETGSKIILKADKNETDILIRCSKMHHFGLLYADQSKEVRNRTAMEVGLMKHHGRIESIDELHLKINEQLDSYKELQVRDQIIVHGPGTIHNHANAFFQCVNGPINIEQVFLIHNHKGATIQAQEVTVHTQFSQNEHDLSDRKYDFQNEGTIYASRQIMVIADNICNKGVIESLKSKVDLQWTTMTKRKTKVEGIVMSPEMIVFTVYGSKVFHCKCYVRSDLDERNIVLPKNGLDVNCLGGSCVFHTNIDGESDINISVLKNCTFLNDVNSQRLTIGYLGNADTQNITFQTIEASSEQENNTTELPWANLDIFTEKKVTPEVNICILNGSTVSVRNLTTESLRDELKVILVTNEGELQVTEDFLNQTDLIIKGEMSISHASKVMAKSVTMTSSSVCRIRLESLIDGSTGCRILANNDIEMVGEVIAQNTEFQTTIESQQGNVTLEGNIDLPELVIASGKNKHIHICSEMNIDGKLCFARSSQNTIRRKANIRCATMRYEPFAEIRDPSFYLDGYIYINGTVTLEQVDVIKLEGELIHKGLSASSASVHMTSTSLMTILPTEVAPVEESDAIETRIICSLGNLLTEKDAVIVLRPEEHSRSTLYVDTWEHYGRIEIQKDERHKHRMEVFIDKFNNYGELENLDKLSINVSKALSNQSNLVVHDMIKIYGNGDVLNKKESEICCENGSIEMIDINSLTNENQGIIQSSSKLTISVREKVENTGTMAGKENVYIGADDITNNGKIESMKSEIIMEWKSKDCTDAHINGVVKSPTSLKFLANKSNTMHFSCTGGDADLSDTFVIPLEGLTISSAQGFVVFARNVSKGINNANLNVVSTKGCFAKANVTVDVFKLERGNQNENEILDQTYIYNRTENQTKNQIVELCVDQGYCFEAGIVKLNMGYRKTVVNINTEENGKLMCHHKLLVDSILTVNGNVDLSTGCTVQSELLKLEKGSTCNIISIPGTYQTVSSETTEKPECTFCSRSEIVIDGNVFDDKTSSFSLNLVSQEGKIEVNGMVSVPVLLVAASPESDIHFHNKINVNGSLIAVRGSHITIGQSAEICCSKFECIPMENCTRMSYMTVDGRLEVHGPVHCSVDSLQIMETGVLHVKSENSTDSVVFGELHKISIKGNLKFEIKGSCIFDCTETISVEKGADIFLSVEECLFMASKKIEMNQYSRIEIERGKLYLTNAKDGEMEIHGDIALSGKIMGRTQTTSCEGNLAAQSIGPALEVEGNGVSFSNLSVQNFKSVELFAAMTFSIDNNSFLQNSKGLEIQATNIDLKGIIENIETSKLLAQSSLIIFKGSRICNGNSIEVLAETVEMKGQINGMSKTHFNISSMLVLGRIETLEIVLETDAVLVNSGVIKGKNAGIVAPIFLSCPADYDVSAIDTIPSLAIESQIKIEGLLCIIIGSHMTAKNINIMSVLHFEFSSKKSTIPETSDLDRWKSIVDSSLSKIPGASSADEMSQLVKKAMDIPKVVCSLGVSTNLCKDIVHMSKEICKGGLDAFNMKDLLGSLDNAHKIYSQISPLKVEVNYIRIRLVEFKDRGKKVARNLINKIFGPRSFSKTLEFQETVEEGIHQKTFISKGVNTECITKGKFTALSLELNGMKGLWQNEGHLEACGDILISAKFIDSKGGKGRLLKAIKGCVRMEGDCIDAKDINADDLDVQATGDAKIASATITNKANVEANNVHIEDIHATSLNVDATRSASIEDADITKDVTVCAKDKIKVKNVTSGDINLESEGNINIDKVKADTLDATSKEGNIALDGKVEAQSAEFNAKDGQISLANRNGKANHKFGSLYMKTKEVKDIENLLNSSGLYSDMKISDHLGLVVEDQDVVLANKQKSQFSISLKAKSIDVRNDMDAESLELEATRGKLKISKNVNLTARNKICLRSAKDLLLENSSLKAGSNVYLESKEDSISMTGTTIKGEQVTARAKKDINISSTGTGANCTQSNITASNNRSDKPAIDIKAGHNINIHNSRISSGGKNIFQAENDINVTAHTYETSNTKTKSSWLGFKKETTVTTTMHVQKPKISGETNSFIAGGTFTSLAAEIKSENGNRIHAKGKISMLDVLGTTKTCTTKKVLGGLLGYNRKDQYSESSHGTLVEDSSMQAHTSIISETSDIEWRGSSLKTPGSFSEVAKQGKITHTRRILQNKSSELWCGFSAKSNIDSILKVGFDIHNTTENSQVTSEDSIDVGGNYSIESKEFAALNSFDINVGGDMILDTEEIRIEGASLHSDTSDFKFGLCLDQTTAQMNVSYSSGSKTQHQTQSLQVGGKLKLGNAKSVTFKNAQVDIGGIEGNVEKMNVISEADTESKTGVGIELGVDVVTRTPSGSVDISHCSSRRVNEVTTLNIHGDSKNLSVGTLEATGAAIIFDGDVHNFAKKVISNEVHEFSNQIALGFAVSKLTSVKGKKKIDINVDASWGRYGSCITSKNGTVDSELAKQVNTDLDQCRKEDGSIKISISHEFKGKLSKQIASIGKQLAKQAGKEALQKYGEQLASELGLPKDIIKNVLDFAEGDFSKEKLFSFVGANLGELCLPPDLMESIKLLINEGNPEKLILWACGKTNIDMSNMILLTDILKEETKPKKIMEQIIVCAAKHVGLSDELIHIISTNIKSLGSSKSKGKDTLSSAVRYLKSTEGLKMVEQIASLLNFPQSTVLFVTQFLKETNYFEKGVIIFEFCGKEMNISDEILLALKMIIRDHDPSALIRFGCRKFGFDTQKTETVYQALSLIVEKNFKGAITVLIKDFGTYCGLPSAVICDLEKMSKGELSNENILVLFLKVFIDIGKATGNQYLQNISNELEKIMPVIKTCIQDKKGIEHIFNKVKNGEFPLEGMQIILFILRSNVTCIPMDLVDGIEQILINHDPRIFVSWLARIMNVDQTILIKLCDGIMHGQNTLEILVTWYLERQGLSEFSPDIILILQGKQPENNLKNISDKLRYMGMTEDNKLYEKFKELGIPKELIGLMKIAFSREEHNTKITMCFRLLASECGFQDDIVTGVIELSLNKKSDLLERWLIEKTGLDKMLVSVVFKCIASEQLNNETIQQTTLQMFRLIGLSEDQIIKLNAALERQLSWTEVGKVVLKILFQILLKSLTKFSSEMNLPLSVLEPFMDIERICDFYELTFEIAKLLSVQIGIPTDLIDAMKAVVVERNCDPLSSWISGKTGFDKKLILSLLQTVLECGLGQIPICFASYNNFSEDTVYILQSLTEGKVPEGDLNELFTTITKDIGKLFLDSEKLDVLCAVVETDDWIARIFHVLRHFVPKLGIPVYITDAVKIFMQIRKQTKPSQKAVVLIEFIGKQLGVSRQCISAIRDLLSKRNPSRLIQICCKYAGLEEQVTAIIAKTLTKMVDKDSKMTLVSLLKDLSTDCGLSSDIISDVEKLFKGKLPVNGIPVFILQIFIQLGKRYGKDEIKESVVKLEDIMPIATEFVVQVKNITSRGKQMTNGKSLANTVQLIMYLLRHIGVDSKIFARIENLVINQNPEILVSWISTITDIDQRAILKLIEVLLNGESLRPALKVLYDNVSKKHKVPADLTEDIFLIIDGEKPKHVLRILLDNMNDSKEAKEKIVDRCKEIGLPVKLTNFVLKLIHVDETENMLMRYLSIIGEECGLPDDFIKGIKDLIIDKNGDILASFIERNTGIPTPVICFAFESFASKTINRTILHKTIRSICAQLDISDTLINKLYDAIDGKLSNADVMKLMFQLFSRVTSPYIRRLTKDWNVPSDIVEKFLVIENMESAYELGFGIFQLIAVKSGIPVDLVITAKEFILDNNCEHLACWLTDKTRMDKTLISSVLTMLRNEQNITNGLVNIPVCVASHYKLSGETINILQILLQGKAPEYDMKNICLIIVQDICKLSLDVESFEMLILCFGDCDWLDRLFHLLRFLAMKFGVPVQLVDGVQNLVRKKDPSALITIVAEKCGIDTNILLIIVDAIKNGDSPKSVLRRFAKYSGIPDAAVGVVEEVIKNKTCVGKSKMYKLYTKPIKWQNVRRSVKVTA